MDFKRLPVGYEDFSKIVKEDCFYIDKTLFIKELLDKRGSVNLFTRPRRFGKTLMMSVLKYFFEDARDIKGNSIDYKYLFDGMKIMDTGDKYTRHMGEYPVISMSLKSGKQSTFESSYALLKSEIIHEFDRHSYILNDDSINDYKQHKYKKYLYDECDISDFKESIRFLSECLKTVSGKDVIILIDEYDVPLEGAWENGFYDKMIDFIRELFSNALKTNDSLEFAIITGCLRISKESIFTGLNNFNINSIMSNNYGEYFGFTDDEIHQMLDYYKISDNYEQAKDWYNGYIFGDKNVYNPWSSILYVHDHYDHPDAFPTPYWANTSSNSIVRTLIDKADREVKDEIENLIAGGTIEKPVHEDITYAEINDSMDNLWNFMFFTGYLKKTDERFDGEQRYLTLKIPNREVSYIYKNKVRNWFNEKLNHRTPDRLFKAIADKDTEVMREEIRAILYQSISFNDYYENFYHGFLAGILYGMDYYRVKSNRESGDGRTDMFLKPEYLEKTAYVFEFKCSKKKLDMEKYAENALHQIDDKNYASELEDEGYKDIVKYGIAFCGKDCFVVTDG